MIAFGLKRVRCESNRTSLYFQCNQIARMKDARVGCLPIQKAFKNKLFWLF
jgi:hypothetical protein